MNGSLDTKWLLNPLDRAAEILFGLIMALTFTCSISIANTDQTEVRQLLVGAIGCNIAWGFVDATMYLIGVLAHKSRSNMISTSNAPVSVRITNDDIKKALALFVTIVVSTLPVTIPFLFINDTMIALRVSNLIAILMMFLCGWSVARYVGYNKWKMSIAMVLIGLAMVAVTIALGG